jgi:hypothetical protein
MSLRALPTALLVAGLALLGLATYSYFARSDGPALVVAEPELEVDDCVPGQETEVVFRLLNKSGRPVRVVGLVPC